ncbi:hypothetical protein BHW_0900018 (plasmid) [Borrelia hermsii MTW]|uniref:Uncharacterized protein n=1 Tax=Borrelia hermsii MTW TaxID=1313291 RepID=W5T5U1_BORHE|nr:hypothetical protein BHW_0900018 [Borrelia hermsii MTW]
MSDLLLGHVGYENRFKTLRIKDRGLAMRGSIP